jgi:hypothetical protein
MIVKIKRLSCLITSHKSMGPKALSDVEVTIDPSLDAPPPLNHLF